MNSEELEQMLMDYYESYVKSERYYWMAWGAMWGVFGLVLLQFAAIEYFF